MARVAGRVAVVISTLNAAATLAAALESVAALAPHRLIVADGGSSDQTVVLASQLGARVVFGRVGRGTQLTAGADAASGADWLLFLHGDSRLSEQAPAAIQAFIADPANRERAGWFDLRLDDDHPAARRLEQVAAWRSRALALPYGNQGLLIARSFYERLGGHRPVALLEDLDLARRLGRARLVRLPAEVIVSATPWRENGYLARSARNLLLVSAWFLRVPSALLLRLTMR